MPKVLVSDKLSPTAVQIFKDNGVEVDYLPDLGKDKDKLFEVIGLDPAVVDLCFRGTQSRIKGATFEDLQEDQQLLAKAAWNDMVPVSQGGLLKFVHGGEYHMYNPDVIAMLQAAVTTGDYGQYQAFAKLVLAGALVHLIDHDVDRLLRPARLGRRLRSDGRAPR